MLINLKVDAMNKLVDGNDLIQILKRLINVLRHTTQFLFIDIEKIKDAVSDALLKYLEHQNDENSSECFESKEKVEAWLFIVSKNILINEINGYIRNNDNMKQYYFEREREIDNVDRDNIMKNLKQELWKDGRLDNIEKTIYKEYYIEGKELKVIAEDLKITPNALYIRKSRLIEKIKKILNEKNIKNMKDLDF